MRIFSAPSRSCLRTLNFHPRSPHGERRSPHIQRFVRLGFQSTLPVRGATLLPLPVVRYLEFQSTLPSRRATNVIWCRKGAHEFQSTLPSRGATAQRYGYDVMSMTFQSTLPSRGATADLAAVGRIPDFNPRSPRGERHHTFKFISPFPYFNPRSPRGERLSPR